MAKFFPIKLSVIEDKNGFAFHCPGCGELHMVQTNPLFSPCWSFNGDVEKPTVSPSILVHQPWKADGARCHSFIKDGKIQFLNDCTHSLAGQTVDLEDHT